MFAQCSSSSTLFLRLKAILHSPGRLNLILTGAGFVPEESWPQFQQGYHLKTGVNPGLIVVSVHQGLEFKMTTASHLQSPVKPVKLNLSMCFSLQYRKLASCPSGTLAMVNSRRRVYSFLQRGMLIFIYILIVFLRSLSCLQDVCLKFSLKVPHKSFVLFC